MTKLDLLIVTIVAICIVIGFFLFVPPVSQINQLQREVQQQQEQRQALEDKVAEYDRQIEKIRRNDPEEIERIARDRLGFGRDGEEIFPLEIPEKQPELPPVADELTTP